MKLDTSAFESNAPIFGASNELLDGFSTAPSFSLPNSNDVSTDVFFFFFQYSFIWG